LDYISQYKEICENLTYKNVKKLEDKNILLTGGSGFIGSWFIDFFSYLNEEILQMPCRVICTEHISKIEETNTVRTIKLDLTKPFDERFEKWDFDYVIHAAGVVSPQEYSKFPLKALDISYLGTKNILEFTKKQKVNSILCLSSAAVYGSPDDSCMPLAEDYVGALSPFSDRSSYTIGKKAMEALCYFYHNKYGLPIKLVRPFNIYGPKMGKSNVVMNFINKILTNQPITIYGDGQQTRTFCYITDAMNGFLRALLQGKQGEVYNIGSERSEVSMLELATTLAKISEKDIEIKTIDYPANYPKNEPRRSCPSTSKANLEIKFYDTVSIEQGISILYKMCEEAR